MDNLPFGVNSETRNAPWNEVTYEIEFKLLHIISDIIFESTVLHLNFTLTEPKEYENVKNLAIHSVYDIYEEDIRNFDLKIKIIDIYEI